MDTEAIPILAMAFVFAGIAMRHQHRSKERLKRLEILEQHLGNPAHEEGTKQELLRRLGDDKDRPSGPWGLWFRQNLTPSRIGFFAGWLTLMVGVAVMLTGSRYDFQGGMIAAFVGFSLLSLPIAVREYEGRRAPRS